MSQSHTVADTLKRDLTAAATIAAKYGNKPDALLEILHDLQHETGFVSEAAIPVLAEALNLSRAEVHGVVSFYHDFRRKPAGRHVIKICKAESCQSMGARDLAAQAEKLLKVKLGETTSDRAITLESVYCLGNCALSPAIMVDDKLVGRADAKKFKKIAAELAA
jgi:formate dehydrogenase subunit gamma